MYVILLISKIMPLYPEMGSPTASCHYSMIQMQAYQPDRLAYIVGEAFYGKGCVSVYESAYVSGFSGAYVSLNYEHTDIYRLYNCREDTRACLKNHSQHLHAPLCTLKGMIRIILPQFSQCSPLYHALWVHLLNLGKILHIMPFRVHMPESIFKHALKKRVIMSIFASFGPRAAGLPELMIQDIYIVNYGEKKNEGKRFCI